MLTSLNRSSCVAWNSTMPLRFVMQPRFSLSIQIYGLQPLSHAQLFRLGADPLLVIPTLDLRSLMLHRATLVVNGTTLVLARVIPRVCRIQGIINVEFVLKTILCSIVLSDVLPSPTLTSLRRSHLDSRGPTQQRTASPLLRPRLFLRTYPLRISLTRNSIYLLMTLLQHQ